MNTFIMNMNIKPILIAVAAIFVFTPSMAQRPKDGGGHRDITNIVSDLSASQKKKLDAINEESKKTVDALRAQQKAVRDSIAMYIHREGDNSRILYPLFDREAQIQSSISREMYSTKIKIDAVLTAEQRKMVSEACRRQEPAGQKSKMRR